MKLSTVAVLLFFGNSVAYQPSPATGRRDFVQQGAVAVRFGLLASFSLVAPVQAIDACPKDSKNCIRTVWSPPASSSSKDDMIKTILDVLNSYPQEGQDNIDKGGWTIVLEDLAGSGVAKVEYKSGIGNFAKFFNGGKPFVDDLTLELDGEQFQVRSSSRVGDSDLGVNQKRLSFLASAVRSKGWTAPDPKY